VSLRLRSFSLITDRYETPKPALQVAGIPPSPEDQDPQDVAAPGGGAAGQLPSARDPVRQAHLSLRQGARPPDRLRHRDLRRRTDSARHGSPRDGSHRPALDQQLPSVVAGHRGGLGHQSSSPATTGDPFGPGTSVFWCAASRGSLHRAPSPGSERMRVLTTVCSLVSRVRVAPSPARAEGAVAPKRVPAKVPKGYRVHPPPPRPVLASKVPRFVEIEREVLERFRPQMRQAVQDELAAVAAAQIQGDKPVCCGKTMRRHDRRSTGWLTWVGLYGCGFVVTAVRPAVPNAALCWSLSRWSLASPAACSLGCLASWGAWPPIPSRPR